MPFLGSAREWPPFPDKWCFLRRTCNVQHTQLRHWKIFARPKHFCNVRTTAQRKVNRAKGNTEAKPETPKLPIPLAIILYPDLYSAYIYTYILYHIISHRLKFQNLVRLHVGHVLIEGQTNHWELGPVNGTGEGDWRGRWDAQAFCKSWQVSSHSTSIQ